MLTSAAIQDHNAPVDVYFALNGAVPSEAAPPNNAGSVVSQLHSQHSTLNTPPKLKNSVFVLNLKGKKNEKFSKNLIEYSENCFNQRNLFCNCYL